ncbi:DUF366 family protein [Thermodesulfitimonas sp.]
MVQTFFIEEPLTYDGQQLTSLWAFRHLRLQGDSIVAFRGACHVRQEALVDLADHLDGAFIYSPDMLHFLAEHFESDLEKGVLRQRLLVTLAKEILEEILGIAVKRRGDDLFVAQKKLSVSIATVTPVSVMIHLGLNVKTEGVPVPAVGLAELGLPEGAVRDFAARLLAAYAAEMKEVWLARCKVRGVP